ncbi:tautomerase family protein [Pseudonocardia abyssalis]|uniref:Tautomerase family protein n=1 Tax=Pseudonocardia abyssalis TaxID=2792008 RepID=A0ABS6UMR8_9PSEU|nr:tautomerase family protein [Pseudonocardia abyssalis]MBW0117476.1 tautomerase family protein [Pseudonocardia abyssalis]MBW0133548.1 tautomerase family protein [Pseudonocardia abyssalis]
MPFYQFTIPADGPSAQRKAEIAAAFTKVHTSVTGAPARYVNCSFVEVPSGSLFVADEVVEHGRMIGLIRSGRTEAVKRELITGLAQAWAEVTGEPVAGFALFLQEVPGHAVMEHGEILPEAADD